MNSRPPRGVLGWLTRRWRQWGDEWWLEVVASEFGFLERFGFQQTDVFLHFKGSAVTFEGPLGAVRILYPSSDNGPLDVEYLRDGMTAWYAKMPIRIGDVIGDRGLDVGNYHRYPRSTLEARESFATLASGLKAVADELFGSVGHRST